MVSTVDPAVHGDRDVQAACGHLGGERLQLGQDVGQEGLAAEAGMDGHHQQQVDPVEVRMDRFRRRLGLRASPPAGPPVDGVNDRPDVIRASTWNAIRSLPARAKSAA